MKKRTHSVLVAGILSGVCLLTPLARAQESGSVSAEKFKTEMHEFMETMNRDMMGKPMTGDPDRDFLIMMIPHHQGAIDMAKLQLKYGKDAKLKEMSRMIISAQEKEIQEMQQLLESFGGSTTRTLETKSHTNHGSEHH